MKYAIQIVLVILSLSNTGGASTLCGEIKPSEKVGWQFEVDSKDSENIFGLSDKNTLRKVGRVLVIPLNEAVSSLMPLADKGSFCLTGTLGVPLLVDIGNISVGSSSASLWGWVTEVNFFVYKAENK